MPPVVGPEHDEGEARPINPILTRQRPLSRLTHLGIRPQRRKDRRSVEPRSGGNTRPAIGTAEVLDDLFQIGVIPQPVEVRAIIEYAQKQTGRTTAVADLGKSRRVVAQLE